MKLISVVAVFALTGQTGAFLPLSQQKTTFKKTHRFALPDSLGLPSDASSILSSPPPVAEAVSVITEAAPPATEIIVPDIGQVVGLDMDMLPIGLGALALVAVAGFLVSSGGDKKAPTDSPPSSPEAKVDISPPSTPSDVPADSPPSSPEAKVDTSPPSTPRDVPADSPPSSPEAKVDISPPSTPSDDISIPYDAAAKLAYDATGSKGDYATFKTEYEKKAVEDVIKKQKARKA